METVLWEGKSDNYYSFFTAFPWFKEVYREVIQIENGENQSRNISVIRKYEMESVYTLKSRTKEKN